MGPIQNIRIVAKYEVITLLRSWFFRIFSILALAALTVVNIVLFTDLAPVPWSFRGIPSSIPYMNILFLNLVQAVIAIFLSSDFLKRDRKLDTTEVIYARPVSNLQYVTGKTAGIMLAFIFLNSAVLILSLVFNLFFAGVELMPLSYLIYPLLISLPTVVFILGLSFLSMVLIRNQAVTFILLLGYVAATTFYLSSRFYNLFDYMGFYVPLMYSDMAGFGGLGDILAQRGFFLLLGVSFILVTSLSLRRLPQSPASRRVTLAISAALAVLAVFAAFTRISDIKAAVETRQTAVRINSRLGREPRPGMEECDLLITHSGESIDAEAEVTLRNRSDGSLDRYILRLNPGLRIEKVASGGNNLRFERDLHLLIVYPPRPLPGGAADRIRIEYSGVIDETLCYTDIGEELLGVDYRIAFFGVKKRYAFIEPDYILLTPESGWYPRCGTGFRAEQPVSRDFDFTLFRLRIKTDKDLRPVSQGEAEKVAGGDYIFSPETPMPGLTLIAGRYEARNISVDSIAYTLFTAEDHDYFSSYFDSIGDTLPRLIREAKMDFENTLDLSYPYSRLKLVEVPINFHCYNRVWTLGYETVQPELVMLPEKGVSLEGADFRRRAWFQRRRERRSDQTAPDMEKQSEMLERFISSTLTADITPSSFRRDPASEEIGYSIFPCYYSYVNHIESDRWPALDVALESFLAEKIQSAPSTFMRFINGMSDEEMANMELGRNSMEEILGDPEKREIKRYVVDMKGEYLFHMMGTEAGEEKLSEYIKDILKRYKFRVTPGSLFVEDISRELGIAAADRIDNWYQSDNIPGFIVSAVKANSFLDSERTRYQVEFDISNPERAEGLVKVTLKKRETRRRRRFGPPPGGRRGGEDQTETERYIRLEGGQSKRIGLILNYQPRVVTFDMKIARNLPVIYDRELPDFEMRENPDPLDGERVIEDPDTSTGPGVTIVDNEDPSFQTVSGGKKTFLRRILPDLGRGGDDQKYVGLRFWETSNSWKATISQKFYGRYVRSAHYTSSGDGKRKAIWTGQIPESGNYEVYCHISKIESPWGKRRKRESGGVDFGTNHYFIHHDDGVEEAAIDLNTAAEGWNYLGSYYFSRGTAGIEISNEAKSRFVIADAVKWVIRK